MSLRIHLDFDARCAAAPRHGHHAIVESHPEIQIYVRRRIEETLDIAIVERFHAKDVGSGLESRDCEGAIVGYCEPANQRAGGRIECDDKLDYGIST